MGDLHHIYSPSRLARLQQCPGSVRLCRDLPPPPPSEDASEGTLLHSAVAAGIVSGNPPPGLDTEQEAAVQFCLDWVRDNNAAGGLCEVPLTIVDGLDVLTEGTADYVAVHPPCATLADWKFGRNEVAEAADNIQLATYALGVHQMTGAERVTAYMVQPRLRHVSSHEYSQWDAVLATIRDVIAATQDEAAPVRPGPECRYCPAALSCQAKRGQALELVDRHSSEITDPAAMAKVLEWNELASDYVARLEERIKSNRHHALAMALGDRDAGRAAQPIPGWTVKEEPRDRKIVDLNEAYARLAKSPATITPEEFVACCTGWVGKLEEQYAANIKARGMGTKVKAREQFQALLADVVTRGAPSRKLVREG